MQGWLKIGGIQEDIIWHQICAFGIFLKNFKRTFDSAGARGGGQSCLKYILTILGMFSKHSIHSDL